MIVKTPPMGWNSWNTFGPNINDELIRTTADAMVENGLLEAGYNYLVIDDCWSLKERDENGKLVADPVKFPHGMKDVADYVHSKGLKFGMYSCAGTRTCADYPGSFDHEYVDAKTFAEWGVDFLKYDYCFRPNYVPGHLLYKKMGNALANSGRDILFSACSWGAHETHKWIKTTGAHMWRSTGDINDSWASIRDLAKHQLNIWDYNGAGCFNDMDMLVVGMNGKGNVALTGCTFEEYKTHFTLWALFNSPLMIGCDVRNMTDETKTILLNKDVIAINQDPACRQAYVIESDNWWAGRVYMIAKRLDDGDLAIGVFNMGDNLEGPNFQLDSIGLGYATGKKLVWRELWTGETGECVDVMRFHNLQPHACRLFRCKIVDV